MLPKTRKVRRLGSHGGAAIAEGKFGCVYAPPFPCASAVQPQFNFPVVSKLVKYSPDTKREIAASHIIHEKLADLPVAVPVHVCNPGQPTAEERRTTFKARKACVTALNDTNNSILIYMPQIPGSETSADFFRRTGAASAATITHFYANTIESICRLATYNSFLIHMDLHAGNILALPNQTSALCDFGASLTNDPRAGSFVENIKEWWNERSYNFESRVTRVTMCPLTLLVIARLVEPGVDYISLLTTVSVADRPVGAAMTSELWDLYIKHIVVPRFTTLVSRGTGAEIYAAIRFNDIHAFGVLLLGEHFRHLPELKKTAFSLLMARVRTVADARVLLAELAASDPMLALAAFATLASLDAFMFVHDAPAIYRELWALCQKK